MRYRDAMTDLVENKDLPARQPSFTIMGREIVVAPLSTLADGQVLGFMKIFRRYMHGSVDGETMTKLDQALSKLIGKVDNDWLDWNIMEDNIKWSEVLVAILPCLRGQDAAPAKPVKPTRARKVAPKKAVAKKAPAKRATKRA